jgi:hypothetical protein
MQKSPRSSAAVPAGTPGQGAVRRWSAAGLLSGLVLMLGLVALSAGTAPTGEARASGPCTASHCVGIADPAGRSAADPSPTPTLGSTERPNPNPPGDNDGDASDFSGAVWILPAAFILAGIAGTVYFLRTRSRNRSS